MASPAEVPVRILIINPNTSKHMTDALKPVIEALGFPKVSCPDPSTLLAHASLTGQPTGRVGPIHILHVAQPGGALDQLAVGCSEIG